MKRAEILSEANKCVTTDRETQYGAPEYNFQLIAKLWNVYMGTNMFNAHDVGMMMALLKVARIMSGQIKEDNYIDLAGYIACAGEIATDNGNKKEEKMNKFYDLADEIGEE